LKEIGLEELSAASMDGYVAIAVALAHDRERLAALRSGMRGRLQASSLGDESGFTRRLEAAYRDMRTAAEAAMQAY
jgi:predicted O-linked N-acetylglucosamine transferase (SPINDLY family)